MNFTIKCGHDGHQRMFARICLTARWIKAVMLSFNGEKPDLLVHDVRPAGDREQEILLVHLGPLFRVDPLAAMFLFCSYGVKPADPPFQAALEPDPGKF
jgi:hypothetical protein